MTTKPAFSTIDEYIALFPEDVQTLLQTMRKTIAEAAPKAQETISYNIPAFKQKYVLVYFAGYKKHIGFYPTSGPISVFQKEIAGYKSAKGSVQFPLDQPLPIKLIQKMVKYRVKEDH